MELFSLLLIAAALAGLVLLSLPLVLVAGVEHARSGRGTWPRALLVATVNAAVAATLAAIPAVGVTVGIGDERAGDALVALVSMAAGTGAIAGFLVSLLATLGLSWTLARRRARANKHLDAAPTLLRALSATSVASALIVSLLTSALVAGGLSIGGVTWGLVAGVASLPGITLALLALSGRRWLGGGLALLLNLLPVLAIGLYAAWALPEIRVHQQHEAQVVDKGVLDAQDLLQPIPRDRDATHRGLHLTYLSCEQDLGIRLTPLSSVRGREVPTPELSACLDQYEPGDTLTLSIDVRYKRFSGDFVQYEVVQVEDCPIPREQASTVPALTHCVVVF
jgi:hypothetical protein